MKKFFGRKQQDSEEVESGGSPTLDEEASGVPAVPSDDGSVKKGARFSDDVLSEPKSKKGGLRFAEPPPPSAGSSGSTGKKGEGKKRVVVVTEDDVGKKRSSKPSSDKKKKEPVPPVSELLGCGV